MWRHIRLCGCERVALSTPRRSAVPRGYGRGFDPLRCRSCRSRYRWGAAGLNQTISTASSVARAVKACPLGNDGLRPRAVVPFADAVEQAEAKLASTSLGDEKSPGAQVAGQLKRERRIVYADSHCQRSLVRPSFSSLYRNDLAES